ncbi:ABC transporter ATP-binding protein [Clostridium algidicarnis]|uniref:Sodium transport system ATP-binding protein n=2 Tax=Clostridium algidicarnis TaxID=37659 RepID=A0A2S6FVX4_9CLOT|nr:ATP-binding cassette domain-containing protein [Clostridium algidicarnis]MBB6631732.1 ATP-binding cassette domain-containing protein [Clostridium algidicarnis]MBB6697231.1 ATP-binding cassette domain-containing protein [Clostridium algidicarnis]MBU3194365.1 ATP-binding cassette domain-containing protein [Clostridium algidicarnis]MBU3206371.1 ATP-binding cassette domain-containing protein [Clostridium algidicarnis]MBU3220018.1 ATP-binding cassette domain-containing protein [Clostridium algid
MVEVIGLSKQFKSVKAVDDISFKVSQGEIVGLLGENGAGKTTTLRMLATMLKPTSGTVRINNYDVVNDAHMVRGEIGILFGGEVGLYDRLTARENIKYFAQLNGVSNQKAEEQINKLVKAFNMQEYIDRRVGKFSRGMKQKVAIARSIVHDPKIMLFDEPTAGLDISASKIIHDFILHCKEENKAIVFSSHMMNEVEKLCDRVVIINKGKIVEDGKIDKLKEKYNDQDMESIFTKLIGGDSKNE